jgi:hypothetical protein
MATREVIRDHTRTHQQKPSSFWFKLTIIAILLFGCVLALILWLSSAHGNTSNDPNRQPHNNSSQQFQRPAVSALR